MVALVLGNKTYKPFTKVFLFITLSSEDQRLRIMSYTKSMR